MGPATWWEGSMPEPLPDGVMVEVLRNRFMGLVRELGGVIRNAAHTVFVKETADFGAYLVSPGGEVFMAPDDMGIFITIGTPMDTAVAAVDDYREGDVYLTNDPETSGGMVTHLPDLFLWTPLFAPDRPRPVAFAFCFVHATDVGGLVPGSVSPSARDMFQEGLIVPPTRLCRDGELNRDLLAILMANTRSPELNRADLRTARRRFRELIDAYGTETVERGIEGVLAHAEGQARAVIAAIPDGTYTFSDYLEADFGGSRANPVRIKLDLVVEGSELTLDFSRTDPQVPLALNLTTHGKPGHNMVVPALVNYFRDPAPEVVDQGRHHHVVAGLAVGGEVERQRHLGVGAGEVEGQLRALDDQVELDPDGVGPAAPEVGFEVVGEGVGAVGDGRDHGPGLALGVGQHALDPALDRLRAVGVDQLPEAAPGGAQAGHLGAQVAPVQLRGAGVGHQDGEQVPVQLPVPAEPGGRDDQALLEHVPGAGADASRDQAAHVGGVDEAEGEGHRPGAVGGEERGPEEEVGQVGDHAPRGLGIVGEVDVPLPVVVDGGDGGVHGGADGDEDAHVVGGHEDLTPGADQVGAEVRRLLDEDGVGGVADHAAQLPDQAHEAVAQDLDHHPVGERLRHRTLPPGRRPHRPRRRPPGARRWWCRTR